MSDNNESGGKGSQGNGQIPSGNGQIPSGNGQTPSGNGQIPSGNGQIPSGNGQIPPGNGQIPPGNGQVPPGNGQVPAREGRTPPRDENRGDEPDANANLHPIYDQEGVPGPSQPEPVIPDVLADLDDDDDDKSDRLPIIPEDTLLRTSGSFERDDGWRAYLTELTQAIDEAESEEPASPLIEKLPEKVIEDMAQAREEIRILRQVTLSQKRQLAEYKALNEELRKKMGKKDRKINQISEELKECIKHRSGLELQNRRMSEWLQTNAPDWDEDLSSNSPPPSPGQRTGTPVRAKRRPVHPISPSSSESGSKRSVQHSPEILRRGSTEDVADTPALLTSPGTPSSKRSLSESGSESKRRRSTTPPPTVSVASVTTPVLLPSPILPLNTDPPGGDGDDDGHSSNGRRGGRRRIGAPRGRRVLGPRPGAFIPPPPPHAQEQPRVWQRGPGRTTNLRPRVPLNLNVDQWFAHHLGRL